MGTHLDIDDAAAGHPMAQQELDALRKDADRYRWLRECDSGNIAYFFGNYDGIRCDELDAAIDAAIDGSN